MKNIYIILGMIFLVGAFLGCRSNSDQEVNTENYTSKHGFPIADPSDVGLNKQILAELVDSIRTDFYPNRHSILIYKGGKLIMEEYFSGHDEIWGSDIGNVQYNDTVLHDMRSVSKSVVSACIGIAVGQGMIESVNQPIFDFFKDYQQFNNGGREQLTIKHLLTMTSGLKWNEDVPYDNPENSEIQMIRSGDGIGFVLSRELTSDPGTVWQYNGGTTELLAEIIYRVSGKDIHEFAKTYLFEPIGIQGSEWTVSPSTNTPSAASGLRLTSADMIKFGVLYMEDGMWGTQQILPKEWVVESLRSHIDRQEGGGYGYQFWILDFTFQGKKLTIPAAVGNGDQRIFIDRKNDLLVITTAGNYNQWDIKNNASRILEKIYASFNFIETN